MLLGLARPMKDEVTHERAQGGKPGTGAAVAERRQGGDDTGERICEQLQRDNVDIAPVEAIPSEATGVAMIFVNSRSGPSRSVVLSDRSRHAMAANSASADPIAQFCSMRWTLSLNHFVIKIDSRGSSNTT